jgi:hypothetical protein
MSGRVLRFDDPAHHRVWELLPWFVNGTLEGEELTVVEQHVRECARCQHEIDSLRQFQAAYMDSETAADPADSLRKLRGRPEEKEIAALRPPHLARLRRLWQQRQGWAPWAMAAELLVIVVLGSLLAFGGGTLALYRTLGTVDPLPHATGNVVVVFDPRITEAELRQIVRATGGRIVDGPTGADAYVLELPAERQAAALEALRAQRAVVLAQRLDRGDTR